MPPPQQQKLTLMVNDNSALKQLQDTVELKDISNKWPTYSITLGNIQCCFLWNKYQWCSKQWYCLIWWGLSIVSAQVPTEVFSQEYQIDAGQTRCQDNADHRLTATHSPSWWWSQHSHSGMHVSALWARLITFKCLMSLES